MCDSCGWEGDDENIILGEGENLQLCCECLNSDSRVIEASKISTMFRLRIADIKDVRSIKIGSRFMRTYYLVQDLEEVVIEKYGSVEKMQEIRNETKNRKQKIKNEKKESRDERKRCLEAQLGKYGLQILSNSKYCNDYIEMGESAGYGLDDIAVKMAEVDFLDKYTRYFELIPTHFTRSYIDLVSDYFKTQAIELFVKENIDFPHKIMSSVPPSLIDEVDQCYRRLTKYCSYYVPFSKHTSNTRYQNKKVIRENNREQFRKYAFRDDEEKNNNN